MIAIVNSAGVAYDPERDEEDLVRFHSTCLPYGPAMLVAALRAAGFAATLRDLRNTVSPGLSRQLDEADFVAWLEEDRQTEAMAELLDRAFAAAPELLTARLVGLSVFSFSSYGYARSLAKAIKRSRPEVLLCFGGPYVTIRLDHCPPEVDFVVRGVGRRLLLHIADHVENGSALDRSLPGLVAADGGGERDSRVHREPADDEPLPDFSDLRLEAYADTHQQSFFWRSERSRALIPYRTTIGCPGRCSFCTGRLVSHYDLKSPAKALVEIEQLSLLAPGSDLLFCDASVNSSPRRAARIFEGMRSRGLRIGWYGYHRPHGTNRGLLATFAETGCRGLYWGLEAVEPRTIARYNKRFLRDQAAAGLAAAAELGILNAVGIIYNGPGESEEDIDRIEAFVDRFADNDRVFFVFNPLVIEPGSDLEREPERYGIELLEPGRRSLYSTREGLPWKDRGVELDRFRRGQRLRAARIDALWRRQFEAMSRAGRRS